MQGVDRVLRGSSEAVQVLVERPQLEWGCKWGLGSRAGGGAKEAPEVGREASWKMRGGFAIWGERGVVAAVTKRGTLENDRWLEGCKRFVTGTVSGKPLLSPEFSSPQWVLRKRRQGPRGPGASSVDVGFTLNLPCGRIQSYHDQRLPGMGEG